jgi:hypothetical protein
MRKKEIRGIMHDLLAYYEWRNPLSKFSVDVDFEVDLLSGEISREGGDDIYRFFKAKVEWFLNRVSELKGNLEDFESAKIFVTSDGEKVVILYKGEKFEKEFVIQKY